MSRRQRRARATRRNRRLAAIGTLGGGATLAVAMLSGAAADASATPKIDSGTGPTITVTSTGDTASPSAANVVDLQAPTLADAISYLDATSTGGTITFASGVTGTIDLTSALPQITEATAIDGPGSGSLTIDNQVTTAPAVTVDAESASSSISGVTITGDAQGIDAESPLTVSDSAITGNTPTASGSKGGGIYSDSQLTVDDSTFTGNTAYVGGGIYAYGTGGLTITDSTFSDNTATYVGGVAIRGGGQTTIDGSTISANQVTRNCAGFGVKGIPGTPMHVYVENSTIADNTAAEGHGGLYAGNNDNQSGVSAPTLTILGSTIDGNAASAGPGGGISLYGATADLDDSIVAGNTDTSTGSLASPDIYLSGGSGPASSLSASFSLVGVGDVTGYGTITPDSTDIVGTNASPVNPELGALADNGGPTETMAPASGSPALGSGNAELFADTVSGFPFTTDQRGAPRVGSGGSSTTSDGTDIGAVELQPTPSVTGLSEQTGKPGQTVTITGTGFWEASAVDFGTVAATSFTYVSPTQITAVVPAGTGSADVTVTTPSGTSADSSESAFTYEAATTPTPPAPKPICATSPKSGTTSTSKSVRFDNQRITLTASTAKCEPVVTFRTSKLARKTPKLTFEHAVLSVSGSSKTYEFKHASGKVGVPVTGLRAGAHTLKAKVTYTERVRGRKKTRTKTLSVTVEVS